MKFSTTRRVLMAALCLIAVSSCKTAEHTAGVKTAVDGGFRYDSLTVEVLSSDGKPIPNVDVRFMLDAVKFYWTNPNSFYPSLFSAGYYNAVNKIGSLGFTDANGKVSVNNVEYIATSNKPTALRIFPDPNTNAPCNAQDPKSKTYRIYLGGMNITGKSSQWACSANMAHNADDPKSISLSCTSEFSLEKIKKEADAAKKSSCN
jgi:hypothetical protein